MNKRLYLFLGLSFILTAGCQPKAQEKPEMPPPEVGVVTITSEPTPVITELPGPP